MTTLLEKLEAALEQIVVDQSRESVAAVATDFARDRDALNATIRKWQSADEETRKKRDFAIYDAEVSRQAMDDEKEAHAWTKTVLATTRVAYDGVAEERDQARAELASVAAQSVELAARVAELEALLKRALEDVELEASCRRTLYLLSEAEIERLRASTVKP